MDKGRQEDGERQRERVTKYRERVRDGKIWGGRHGVRESGMVSDGKKAGREMTSRGRRERLRDGSERERWREKDTHTHAQTDRPRKLCFFSPGIFGSKALAFDAIYLFPFLIFMCKG